MPTEAQILEAARNATQGVYERHAASWHAGRLRNLYERIWLDPFMKTLPSKSRVLDLGCGTGAPVAEFFLGKGFEVVGVDYAPSMIEFAKAALPSVAWHVGDIRALPPLGHFDGIYSWDGFFHLSVKEQRAALPALSRLIRPGGALLLTVGTGEGEVTGTVEGETVYHASLSPTEYEETLRACGFEHVIYKADDPDCMRRSLILASGMND